MKLVKRFFKAPSGSFFLFGPRGTGKSTWLKQNFPDALRLDFLDPSLVRKYSSYPERLKETVLAQNSTVIILDEIQHVPELLTVVHSLIETEKTDKEFQFILTGSSARKLRRAGTNLLGGRASVRYLHPFMAAELGSNFDLKRALQFGMLPVIVNNKEPADAMQGYITLYLREEVQTEGLVRNIGDFSRFIETAAFSHAGILNVSNIARECSISRKTIEGYLSILEDLLISFTVPIFTKRAKRSTVAHSKFYYFDAGVYNHLREQGYLDRDTEISGMALEGLVAEHLRSWCDYQNSSYRIYFWRTRSGVEVDFIVYGQNGFFAIEVKNSQYIHPKDLTGLKSFCEDYPEATPVLLYRGNEKLKKNNILCLPVTDFLAGMQPELPLIAC
ncbi:MAG: AAA family ATPase [Gammaproteobacteria bacterium]|nr:AAA family ATPase [Gammaproteobacteria bacterium]